MKKLLLLLLLSFPVFAQNGFKADAGNVVWERSFNADNANIIAILDRNPDLKVGAFMDNLYKGFGVDVQNTCNGGTPLMKNNLKFEFVILLTPGSYVVKIRNIRILEKYGPMQAKTVANRCEKYFMAGTKLSTEPNASSNMACLDRFLTGLFSPLPETSGKAITSN